MNLGARTAAWTKEEDASVPFVVVGSSGYCATSNDGVTWCTPFMIGANSLTSVAYGNGKWVAVGDSGDIFVSTDAVNWTLTSISGFTGRLRRVAFGNGVFVVAGEASSDDGVVAYSYDGCTWSKSSDSRMTQSNIGVYFIDNRFFLVQEVFYSGNQYDYPVYSSDDGLNWDDFDPSGFRLTSGDINGMCGTAEKIFMCGYERHAGAWKQVKCVSDGGEFEKSRGIIGRLTACCYAGGLFVIGGYGSDSSASTFSTSADCATWTSDVTVSGFSVKSLISRNGMFFACGTNGAISRSLDGASWETPITVGSTAWFGMA